MKEFMMIFRQAANADYQPSASEIQAEIKKWQDWIGNVAAQNKFVRTGQLVPEGKVLKPNNLVTDGPYAELKEIIGGYLLVKAENLEEALEMARDCPVLAHGGNVEIRPQIEMNF